MKHYKKLFAILTLVCFMMTLMPIAAFAAIDSVECSVFTDDTTAKVGKDIAVQFDLAGQNVTTNVYVWFIKDGSNVPAVAVTSVDGFSQDSIGVFTIPAAKVEEGKEYNFQFSNAGSYTVAAAFENPADVEESTTAAKIKNVEKKLTSLNNKKSFEITSSSDSDLYTLQLVGDAKLPWGGLQVVEVGDDKKISIERAIPNNGQATIGAGGNLSVAETNKHLPTNGVASDDITFKLLDKDGKAVKGATVKLSTSNTNCVVNKEKVTTDQLGQFKFTIAITEESPNIDGFTIYIECGSYEGKLQITASSTGAYDLAFTKMPTVALSTDDCVAGSYLDDIWVAVKDVNGNFVKPYTLQPGGNHAEPGFAGVIAVSSSDKHYFTNSYIDGGTVKIGSGQSAYNVTAKAWGKSAEEYVSIVSKPEGSKLENKDIWLTPVGSDAPYQNTLFTNEDLIAGEYTLKLTLADGKYKTITFTVAEMGTPVKLTVTPKAAATELGTRTSASFKLVDANGVGCDALKKGTDVAVSGYGVLEAVNGYENQSADIDNDDNTVYIYTKNDDKYAGSEIKIIATNDRYNLVGEGTIKLNDGKAFIYIPVNEAKINTPTDITYLLMDGQNMMNITIGNNLADLTAWGVNADVAPTGTFRAAGGQTSFVVKAKPEGAKVNFDARAAGGAITSISGDSYAVGRIECDKPGVVTVQMSIGVEIKQADGTWSPRYYTGTQNIVFSDGSIGKTVVMSIGSSEIVIDGEKAAIDAAPIVQNSRTYVPFRALAEAFGAEVAYDEATQAVTATLGSNTVVMTIGSAAYTVNGEEKTADVAPFISGGRTMVPVRFAAEAFGSKVIPTYDDNGATADVLFKL